MRIIPVLLLSMMFSVGCESSGESEQAAEPTTHTVEIKDMKYIPADLVVSKGDIVIFMNQDMVNHDVTESKESKWTSGPIPPGTSWTKVFSGSADYYCSLHKVMTGKIQVE